MQVIDYFELDDNTTLTAKWVRQQMRKSEGKCHPSWMRGKKRMIENESQTFNTGMRSTTTV